jgi:hypothetical protein
MRSPLLHAILAGLIAVAALTTALGLWQAVQARRHRDARTECEAEGERHLIAIASLELDKTALEKELRRIPPARGAIEVATAGDQIGERSRPPARAHAARKQAGGKAKRSRTRPLARR